MVVGLYDPRLDYMGGRAPPMVAPPPPYGGGVYIINGRYMCGGKHMYVPPMYGCILILPLLGIIAILLVPRGEKMRLWNTALEWALLTLTGTTLLWSIFNGGGTFRYISLLTWMPGSKSSNITSNTPFTTKNTVYDGIEPGGYSGVILGVDGISLFFIILTALLTVICVLISTRSVKHLVKEYLVCLLLMAVLLIGVFSVLDLIGFYILFEGILIPMFLIIGI